MENILKVDLGASTAPIVQEVANKQWIEYGTAEWQNLFPQFLIDLYYNSSTQAAIINATADMICGEDLIIDEEDGDQLDAIVKLKRFMANANSAETLNDVIKKLSFDFKLQGGFALNIIWSTDRTQISEIYHIPCEKIRSAKPNEMGKVEGYYISGDWKNIRKNKPVYVPAFSTTDRTSPNQILYTGLYSPSMSVYHTPDYVAANNWALIDSKISEYHLNNISNGFMGSYFLSFANGIPTQEERLSIEQSLAQKFAGSTNAGKMVLTFSDDKTRTPEITPISVSDADKQYIALQELMVQNILTGHRCTSPVLMGIKSDTGLGNNADELNSAANYYLNTVIKPYQNHILKTLKKIFEVNQMNLPVSFVQLKPITTRFTNQDLMAVMTQDEIREELGLAPLDERIDVDLTKMSQKLKLENWIENFGEQMQDEWEVIDEEIVDGEHIEFDFENQLNQIHLAEEIVAKPNIVKRNSNEKDEEETYIDQDGVNKSYSNFYKVRYVYATDNFLENKSGTSREFCELMVDSKKVYRKRDILNADSLEVNEGFGPYGKERYNLFLFKGGPQCRHFWLRRIYKSSLRNAKKPIQDEQLISHVKALSEGFTVKKNDKLVAIAPQRMKNNGYLKPR